MKISLKQLTFYFAWLLYTVNYIMFEQSQFKNFNGIAVFSRGMQAVTIILLLITVLFHKVKKKMFVQCGLIVCIFIISYFTADSWTVMFWGMFSLSAFSIVDYKQFLKIDLAARSIMYVFIMLCVVFGVVQNEMFDVSGYKKASLGYIHYNMFGMNMGIIIAEMLALFRDNKRTKWKMYFVVLTISVFQIFVGVGRTGLYGSVFVLALSILLENINILKFIQKHEVLFSLWSIILAVISYSISYTYDSSNRFMLILNRILTSRISFSKKFLTEYDLSLFGHKMFINNDRSIGQYSALDMGYIRAGLQYGLLILFLWLITNYILQRISLKSNNTGLYLASIYYCIAMLGAASVINIANNCLLILTFQVIFSNSTFITKFGSRKHGRLENNENRTLHALQNR